jgi:outer membrane murein-binding lipoprotein Lpp
LKAEKALATGAVETLLAEIGSLKNEVKALRAAVETPRIT